MRNKQTEAARAARACEALSKAVRTRVGTAPSPIDRALLVAAAGSALAAACAIAQTDSYPSRADARVMKQNLEAEILALAVSSDALDQVVARGAGAGLADALMALRDAFATHMNEVIGALPAVKVRTLGGPVSAWEIVQAEFGDAPADLEARFVDFATRNQLSHPGRVPAGRVEILDITVLDDRGAA